MKKLFLMTSVAIAILGIVGEAKADLISCINGKYADGTDCKKCGDNCNWSFNTDTGKLSITGSGVMNDYHMNDYYEDATYGVIDSSNETPWAGFRTDIREVNIGNGITSIGECAFCGVPLSTVTGMKNVTKIGPDAFSSAKGLMDIDLSNVEEIGNYAFAFSGLGGSIEMLKAKKIGYYAFTDTGLVSITIPDSLTDIGENAFLRSGIDTINCVSTSGQCDVLENLLLDDGFGLYSGWSFDTIIPQPSSCPAGTFSVGGECLPKRYTPAELAKVVGESNTILLYYK